MKVGYLLNFGEALMKDGITDKSNRKKIQDRDK
jgi:hypothetical protein